MSFCTRNSAPGSRKLEGQTLPPCHWMTRRVRAVVRKVFDYAGGVGGGDKDFGEICGDAFRRVSYQALGDADNSPNAETGSHATASS